MQNIRPPRQPKTIIIPFSQEDIDKLLLLCSGNSFLEMRNRAIILVFLDTGVRLSESAGIQIDDLDFDKELIKVMGKGAKERFVRIGNATQKALLRYLLIRNDDYKCLWVTEERKPLTKEGIRLAVRNLCWRAGLSGVKCGAHTFRHTFATRAFLNGAREFEVQMILGHSTLAMTRRYMSSLNSEQVISSHKRFSPVDNMKIK